MSTKRNTIPEEDLTLLNKAELSIIKKDLAEANSYYKKVLLNNKNGFADDYYSALEIAIDTKDINFSYFCANKLAKKGFCISFFNKLTFLKSDSKKWSSFEKQINSYHHINFQYRDNLYNLLNEDQLIRTQSDRYKINTVDSLNYTQFKELIKKYGYPTEENIGIECIESNGLKPAPYEILLRHFSQGHFIGMDTLLKSFLEHKVFKPERFANHAACLGNGEINLYPSPIVIIDDTYYTYNFTPVQKENIDKKRLSLGLSNLDDLIKKIKFKVNNEEFIYKYRFCPSTTIEVFGGLPQTVKDRILKKFTKIDL